MEVVRNEDGFNVVVVQCDGCGAEIDQVEEASDEWFKVTISPLARDKWNSGDDRGEYHFCSEQCFTDNSDQLDVKPPSDNDQ